ncbi:hypothetical protein GPECTOR_46g274 [Gonium pectorale]|uniref:Uncharacterized protein n=1 Tax=Gonium pectorale TaxID=33097 RepID=A0A150G9G6_GONPE|nr:hypothetical protein GPECTOR_46g274 [Gonium pectorale]|eukprot:KXZ46205.1 hypothetical protein GPECTOR_46g274 [Gonium pectorale]
MRSACGSTWWGSSVRRHLAGSSSGGPSRDKLLAALAARGVSVLSYIPDASLLVAGRPEDVEEVAEETGAETAEYGPEHRIAPEWAPLAQGPGHAARASAAPWGDVGADAVGEMHGRRLLVELLWRVRGGAPGAGAGSAPAAPADAAAPAGSTPLLARMAVFDPRVVLGGAGLEAARRRMRRQLGEGEVQEDAPLPPLYEVSVDLLPGLRRAALVAAEKEWPEALAKAANAAAKGRGRSIGECLPLVVAPASEGAGDGTCSDCWLRVYACGQHLASAVFWLASQPSVKWVAPGLRITRRNVLSSILAQTGDLTLAQYLNPIGPPSEEASRRPYRAAGLDGSGEVVGIGDTGFDLDSCYFADPRVNGSYIRGLLQSAGPGRALRTTEHRKIAQYYVVSGALPGDDPVAEQSGGHGTHTSGSVAGAVLSGSDPYGPYNTDAATGAAPRARLSMVDMFIAPSATISAPYMSPPQPVDTAYLPLHTAVGARVLSDSWGASFNGYDRIAQGFDRFLWSNPDVVSFLAAGNNGPDALIPGGTVGTPATAKSPLAVGEGMRYPGELRSGVRLPVVRGHLPGSVGAEEWRLALNPRENGGRVSLKDALVYGQRVPLLLAQPPNACGQLANPQALRGAVALVTRGGGSGGGVDSGNCSLAEAAGAVAAAGAAGVVVVYGVPGPADSVPELPLPRALPVGIITKGLGEWLLGNLTAGLSLSVTAENVPASVNAVMYTSSYGPVADGRIKPDIIAPGTDIVSAGAGGVITAGAATCSSAQKTLSGTSMATPQAAGHAALIRQYFRNGFYPTGRPSNTTAFNASGILLKGGFAMSLGVAMGPGPDGFQGWGRLSLSGALPLPGWTDPRVSLQLADRGELAETGQEISLVGLSATGTGPVTVVVTWYDYPADLNAAVQLVNDLDLYVTVAPANASNGSTTTVVANNPEGAVFPSPDRVNTVERVVLSAPPAGAMITITVRAARIASSLLSVPDARLPQRFAVAVVGHISGTLVTRLNPDWVAQQPQAQYRSVALI